MPLSIVVGLGRSGSGAARLLQAQGHDVVVLERGDTPALQDTAHALRQQNITIELGRPLELDSFTAWLDQASEVVISPGIAWDHPTLNALRAQGLRVRGEMSVAWDALSGIPWIGITGTNGKTTVTHLLQHVLAHAGLEAPMAGNVGHSAAELALEVLQGTRPKPDWVVMEMSSYQIEAAGEVSPRIGIWTTLTPDHLERHGTIEAYRAIKRGLLERAQTPVLNADDADIRQHCGAWSRPGLRWVSGADDGPDKDSIHRISVNAQGWVSQGERPLFPADALPLPGDHNRQNMLLATAAALEASVSASSIEAALRCFTGVPHRLEPLGSVGGIPVFNDSKATNYDAAAVGLRSVQAPVVLLAGGQTKQGDAGPWLELLQSQVGGVVLFGAGAGELADLIETAGFTGPVMHHADLNSAVPQALSLAKDCEAGSVLLSPACASFDQYPNFEARGDHFRRLINAVKDL